MLNIGKLDSELLKKIIFNNITFKRPEVLTRPGIGEDCAVMDYGEYECILSTDPITAAVENIGHLAVHISCNDIASNGIEPVGLLLAVMLPVGTTKEQVEEMMKQAGATSEKLGVEIIGGHTEITPAVNQPVIVSTAIGRGVKGMSQSAGDMQVGDGIFITKCAGIEGTAIIAGEKNLSDILTDEEIETCEKFNINPLRLISSGCMMMVIAPEKEEELKTKMLEAGIKFTCIGRVKPKEFGIKFDSGEIISPPCADELYKAID